MSCQAFKKAGPIAFLIASLGLVLVLKSATPASANSRVLPQKSAPSAQQAGPVHQALPRDVRQGWQVERGDFGCRKSGLLCYQGNLHVAFNRGWMSLGLNVFLRSSKDHCKPRCEGTGRCWSRSPHNQGRPEYHDGFVVTPKESLTSSLGLAPMLFNSRAAVRSAVAKAFSADFFSSFEFSRRSSI